MPTKNQSNNVKPIPLEYATPAPPKGVSATRIFAATCSVFIAVISLPCLIVGIGYFFAALNDNYGLASEDIARGTGFIFLGVFCLGFAIRWGRVGFWGFEKSSKQPVNRMKAFGIFLAVIGGLVGLINIAWSVSEQYNPYDRHDFYAFIGSLAVSFLLLAVGLLQMKRSGKNRFRVG